MKGIYREGRIWSDRVKQKGTEQGGERSIDYEVDNLECGGAEVEEEEEEGVRECEISETSDIRARVRQWPGYK